MKFVPKFGHQMNHGKLVSGNHFNTTLAVRYCQDHFFYSPTEHAGRIPDWYMCEINFANGFVWYGMPTVQADSHRGKVCQALSTYDWMDCHEVANAIGYRADSASSVLSDVHRAGYVERRDAEKEKSVDYEYQLKTNVSVSEAE